jgi:hypothetical protein
LQQQVEMEKNDSIQEVLKGNLLLLSVLVQRNLEEERDHHHQDFEETVQTLVSLR